MIRLFAARKIITMDPNLPEATHVAVRDGRVLAVGGADCADCWGDPVRDDRFADKVVLPGLLEAHAHVMAGGIWRYGYVGQYERTDPDGRLWPGAQTNDAIVRRLRVAADGAPPDRPVVTWGYDPGLVDGPRMDRHLLDRAAAGRPVIVFHSNLHVITANSVALDAAGMQHHRHLEGVQQAPDGSMTGELLEFDAMQPMIDFAGIGFGDLADEAAVRAYGRLAAGAGVTTIADLNSNLLDGEVRMLQGVTSEPEFPVRYAPVMAATHLDPEEAAARAVALRARSSEKLFLGSAKLFTDGSIQGRTAQLKPPGYLTGADLGIWNMELGAFRRSVRVLHRAGVKTHVHANGDEATEQAILAYEAAMRESPNPDLRHTIEHAQLAGDEQFRRMRALGLTVNLFANHLHYFGDMHWMSSLGPDRARAMNACADAWRIFDGNFAVHSDAPVTPLAPLATAAHAVNRVTQSGRQLGTRQKITVPQALRCITMGAAHVLKLDGLVGSIRCGKLADFCVLADDPLEAGETGFGEIEIVATVLGGRVTA